MEEWERSATLRHYRKQMREEPEVLRTRAANRRGRHASSNPEQIDRRLVFERDEGICGICGTLVSPESWELDHIIPLSRGGPHTFDNVQVSHRRCNRRKWAKLPEELMNVA
jgi:5-methylcytosine-specific restriction endonuclease McrA